MEQIYEEGIEKLSDLPVLVAFDAEPTQDGTERWKVWCPFCITWHYHGAGPGHRHDHCASKEFTDYKSGTMDLDYPFGDGYIIVHESRIEEYMERRMEVREERFLKTSA
jgi:hypothetical protein